MTTHNKVFVQRRFNCSAQELFQWLVDPTRISQWFGPKNYRVVRTDTAPYVGGNYEIELINNEGNGFTISGSYLKFEPNHDLKFTLSYQGVPEGWPSSEVSIKLESTSLDQSSLTLTQEFEFIPENMAKRAAAWEHMFEELNRSLN